MAAMTSRGLTGLSVSLSRLIRAMPRSANWAATAPKAEVGSWVSEAAREKFMAAYERAFALWPQPVEEFDIETATATTRVHAYRPHPGGAPIVLLTGAGFNASGWYPHVAALAQHHPVYGIDMPGDPNPSVWRAPLTPPASCAAWLDELLGQLSDRPAHLVGLSYGGWVAAFIEAYATDKQATQPADTDK
jgi:Alpha/beta hydrolase family